LRGGPGAHAGEQPTTILATLADYIAKGQGPELLEELTARLKVDMELLRTGSEHELASCQRLKELGCIMLRERNVFMGLTDIPANGVEPFKIKIPDSLQLNMRSYPPRRLAPAMLLEYQKWTKQALEINNIQPCSAPRHLSPPVIVKKRCAPIGRPAVSFSGKHLIQVGFWQRPGEVRQANMKNKAHNERYSNFLPDL